MIGFQGIAYRAIEQKEPGKEKKREYEMQQVSTNLNTMHARKLNRQGIESCHNITHTTWEIPKTIYLEPLYFQMVSCDRL